MQSKTKLICFTYAGGTASFFDDLDCELKDIETIKLEYAGHGERHREEFYNDFDELADDLFAEIKDICSKEKYALFGYSMGSISMIEVLRRILMTDMQKPSHVFLAAHEPYSKILFDKLSDDEIDDWVKERTIQFGGVPDKLLKNNVFWRTYLPVYRADYSIIDKYRFEDLNLKTDIPATVFYSEEDTPFADMRCWDKYFLCEFYSFTGKHFFIKDHIAEISSVIKEKLTNI